MPDTDKRPPEPVQPQPDFSVCDFCGSSRIVWIKCKRICQSCKQINMSCADL